MLNSDPSVQASVARDDDSSTEADNIIINLSKEHKEPLGHKGHKDYHRLWRGWHKGHKDIYQ